MAYGYDAERGQLASVERDGEAEATCGYDGLGRLVTVSDTAAHDGAMAFDGAGNAASVSFSGQEVVLAYEADSNRLASVGGGAVEHGSRGEVTRLAGRRLEYDALGNLVTARAADGTLLARYRYDAYGRRVFRLVGGTATFYLYDAADRLAEVVTRSPDGTVASRSLAYDGPGFTPVAFVDYRPARVVERGALAGAETLWQLLAALLLALLGWVVARLGGRLSRLASATLASVLLLASAGFISSCGLFEDGGPAGIDVAPPRGDAGHGREDGGILPDGGLRDRDGGLRWCSAGLTPRRLPSRSRSRSAARRRGAPSGQRWATPRAARGRAGTDRGTRRLPRLASRTCSASERPGLAGADGYRPASGSHEPVEEACDGLDDDYLRVIRGGSFDYARFALRVAERNESMPGSRDANLGCRCARPQGTERSDDPTVSRRRRAPPPAARPRLAAPPAPPSGPPPCPAP